VNWRAIFAIVRKDVMVALRTKAVVMPLVIAPLILLVGMPLLLGGIVLLAERTGVNSSDMNELQEMIPPALQPTLAGLNATQAGLVFALLYLFAPMFLILPIMVSSVVAADSFAGEKERKTLEALVYTPTTDGELLLAKMLGGWIPGVLVGVGGFVLYTAVVDLVTWQVAGVMLLPNLFWLLLAFWVGPAAAAIGLGVTVLVSARVNTFQEAYQLGSLVVLPVVFIMIGQITGLILLDTVIVLVLGLVFWIIAALLYAAGAATFRRSELMARLS
jgi:ABC-type transport system involved in multi-copper enzyme maturation permease subunit